MSGSWRRPNTNAGQSRKDGSAEGLKSASGDSTTTDNNSDQQLPQSTVKQDPQVTGSMSSSTGTPPKQSPSAAKVSPECKMEEEEEGQANQTSSVDVTSPKASNSDVDTEADQNAAVSEEDVKVEAAENPPQDAVMDVVNEPFTTSRHPCMMLNEVEREAIKYTFVEEFGVPPIREYVMSCEVQGKKFTGQARSKKLARAKSAEAALLELHNITYDPSAPEIGKKAQKSRKRRPPPFPEDEEEAQVSAEPVAEGEEMLGKRVGTGEPVSKKKRRQAGPPEPKNALMHLNELKPGTQFKFISQTGPVHAPVFLMAVEVNNQTFEGRGSSKKLAKLHAAEQALKSFVQFPDASEAHQALGRGFLPSTADFTTDSDILGSHVLFNDFENNNGGGNNAGELDSTADSAAFSRAQALNIQRKLQALPTQQSNKNPVMVLNEIHKGVKYEMVSEVGERNFKVFNMKVTIGTRDFVGSGRSKKLAKYNAALNALKVLHGINHFERRDMVAVNEECIEGDPQLLADHIAQLIFNKFGELTDNFSTPYARRKVLAGVVMTTGVSGDPGTVICVATGTKCINGEYLSAQGKVVNDCHAEVICRRLLMRYLYTQLKLHLDDATADQSVLVQRSEGGFELKEGVKFHLYVSTAPCGDTRIFSPHERKHHGTKDPEASDSGHSVDTPAGDTPAGDTPAGDTVGENKTGENSGEGDKHPNRRARGLLRTKIESGEGTIPVRVSGTIQTWDGVLQGERLLTMSCSDKMTRWNVLGVQEGICAFQRREWDHCHTVCMSQGWLNVQHPNPSRIEDTLVVRDSDENRATTTLGACRSLLSHFITPVYLSSIIVGSWYHAEHMVRGVYARVSHMQFPSPIFKLNKPFLSGITSPECRQAGKTPNFSVNWFVGDDTLEVVNPTTGKSDKDELSRLCKQIMFQDFLSLYGKISSLSSHGVVDTPRLYSEAKAAVMDYQLTKQALFTAFQHANLGHWVKKPHEHDEFVVAE